MLLLGADENSLSGRLDVNQKEMGLKILAELRKNTEISREVTAFGRLCDELENSLNRLKKELEKLMTTDTLSGKCGAIK